MKSKSGLWKLGFGSVVFLGFLGCVKQYPEGMAPMEVNLYVGIEQLARLGETEPQVSQRMSADVSPDRSPASSELKLLGFNRTFHYKNLGVRIYFRNGRVALLEAQEPFQGSIQGKKIRLFQLASPAGKTWEDELTKELGSPMFKAGGGRLGSESLFYSWGDISYNRNGPNEIAIYKDPDIAKYRQKNFGRILKFLTN